MTFIKTLDGNYVNSDLVKHFHIEDKSVFVNELNKDITAFCVFADDILLQLYPYEYQYIDVEIDDVTCRGRKMLQRQIAPDCDIEKIKRDARDLAQKKLNSLIEDIRFAYALAHRT